ncbi:hypothetical protein [Rhodococcus sp. T2V]|uniref:hypothetical protein n=1 Tax=Rhodococcus sp. T2V TaxID=3034164 RepID=UPI0023E0D4EB|nr:hypothetical protein [Rhodococcus sp. T2V]
MAFSDEMFGPVERIATSSKYALSQSILTTKCYPPLGKEAVFACVTILLPSLSGLRRTLLPSASGGNPNFSVRGVYEEEEHVRTPAGWRISTLKLNPMWSDDNTGVCTAGSAALAAAFAG